MNLNIYGINIENLLKRLTPAFLWNPFWRAWMLLFGQHYMDKHEEFLTAIEEYGFLSDINSQVCYLEKILNYKFDSVLKRIIITDDLSLEKKYFFLRPENKPHYLYLRTETGLPTYIYRRDEVSNLAPGFVVHVPNSLNNKEPLIKKIVQRYKLAGIKFKIKYV